MDRKTYAAPVELKQDGDEGSFRATFATLNVIDRDGDVTVPGAFREGQEVRIARWGHNWGDLPVGRGAIFADERQAWVDGQFFLDTAAGADTYRTVKNLGQLQEWSYGFEVREWSVGEFDGQQVRFLRDLDVFEVSPVMLGAGIGTRTDFIKGHGLPYDAHSDNVQVAVTEWLERTRSGSDLRAKEGRAISEARRRRMAGVSESLRTAADEIDAMLEETEPPKAADDADARAAMQAELRRQSLRFQHTLARLRGVA